MIWFLWFVSFCLAACPVALVVHYWRDISIEAKEFPQEWLLRWMGRGLLAPFLVWVLMNVGRAPIMPPLTWYIGLLRKHGFGFTAFMAQVGLATLVMVAFWTVLSFGWFLTNLFRRARNKEDLIIAAVVWGPVLFLLTWPFWSVFRWGGIVFGMLFWMWPLLHYAIGVAEVTRPLPTYSQAIAKIKFGKYSDAEMAIIGQLEKCDTDFEGWMMLADLYANHFHDVAEAEKTICELCDEPTTTPSQLSIALHRLADWQLDLRHDPAAARRVLEEICRRLPGTHLAMMARLRINQLPNSVKELEAQQQPKTVIMPRWVEELDATKPPTQLSSEDAMALVNQFVQQLTKDPNDVPAREKLARVFAGHLGKYELAVEQLELLLGMPEQPAAKSAEWLGLMASWLGDQHQHEKAEKVLERLIHEFPQSQQAFAAQRRLSLLRVKPARLRTHPTDRVEED